MLVVNKFESLLRVKFETKVELFFSD